MSLFSRRVQVRSDHCRELKNGEGVCQGFEETPERAGKSEKETTEGKKSGPEKPVRCNRENCQEQGQVSA